MSETPKRPRPENYLQDWNRRRALAELMLPMIGDLWRRNIQTMLYDLPLMNLSVMDLMKAHRFVRQNESNELSEFDTHPVLETLAQMKDLGSARIDIGKLAMRRLQDDGSLEDFLAAELKGLLGAERRPTPKGHDIVLYGFGRIGRLMARLLVEQGGSGDVLKLRAVVVRRSAKDNLERRASLLQHDSVHGSFQGTIRVDEEQHAFVINGHEVKLIYSDSPSEVDYAAHGIAEAVIIDNTGIWRNREGLSEHLRCAGAAKVLITAPAKGDEIKNIVHGINHGDIESSDRIISASSCTTNAVALPLKIISDKFGIKRAHVETVHAYTNDQNLIDNFHKANRRGRSAPLNLVLTETGAADAVVKVMPELAGCLTGNAIRVPTPNVSLAMLNIQLKRKASAEDINEHLRQTALHSPLRHEIGYTKSPEVVSSDFIGTRYACIFDSKATIVNGDSCCLYFWYDNEFGYANQVFRVLERMCDIHYPAYPNGG